MLPSVPYSTSAPQGPAWHCPPGMAFAVRYQMLLPADKAKQANQLAQHIANGQTVGTQDPKWLEALESYCGQVLELHPVERPDTPAGHQVISFTLGFPDTVGVNELGALMAMAFGKVSMSGSIRWTGLRISEQLAHTLQGPSLGIAGIRQRVGVTDPDHPLVMAILKPCLGFRPVQLAGLMSTQAEAGTHLVKDDEILFDTTLDTALARLNACLTAIERHKSRDGQLLYALNLNGPAHKLFERADALIAAGANTFLFNYLTYGLPMLNSLRQHLGTRAVILAHPALGGAFYGSPWHGMSPPLMFGTLPRLAGADAVLFPSPYGKVSLPREDALAIQHELMTPDLPVQTAFAVPSAGILPSMVPQIISDFGGQVIINAGTGIFDAPTGPFEGAHAFLDQLQQAGKGPLAHA